MEGQHNSSIPVEGGEHDKRDKAESEKDEEDKDQLRASRSPDAKRTKRQVDQGKTLEV